jgi:Family of unknown function (DUF5946)
LLDGLREIQAEDGRRFGYLPAHRLVVDANMAQHPGDGSDRRDRQSLFAHLVVLCAVLEHDLLHPYVTKLPGQETRHHAGDFRPSSGAKSRDRSPCCTWSTRPPRRQVLTEASRETSSTTGTLPCFALVTGVSGLP